MVELIARLVGRAGRILGVLLIGLFVLGVTGAWVPAIPVLGSLGPLMIAPFGSWIVVLSLACALIYVLRWRQQRRRGIAVMVILALFAAIGTAMIEAQQLAAAQANGIGIDLARTLNPAANVHKGQQPSQLIYARDGKNPLRLIVYRPGAPAKLPAPVLVYVHGGGWGGGTPFDRASDMWWFADRGYLVLSVEYTLSSVPRPTWNIAEPQIGCALVWIGSHAAGLGGDAGRLALFGESAGGNLVLNIAGRLAAGTLDPACAGTLPHVAAVIAPYPVIDVLEMYRNGDLVAGPFARTMTTHYTGGTPTEFPERYTAISSGTHIGKAMPPVLLFPGLSDHLLPPVAAATYAAQAQRAGAKVDVIAMPAGEHSFDQSEGSIGSQLVRKATLRFLGEHGLAPR